MYHVRPYFHHCREHCEADTPFRLKLKMHSNLFVFELQAHPNFEYFFAFSLLAYFFSFLYIEWVCCRMRLFFPLQGYLVLNYSVFLKIILMHVYILIYAYIYLYMHIWYILNIHFSCPKYMQTIYVKTQISLRERHLRNFFLTRTHLLPKISCQDFCTRIK